MLLNIHSYPWTCAGGEHTDVTLKLGCGEQLNTHSQMLKVASPFFRDVLADMMPGEPIPVRVAVLPHIHSCMGSCLTYRCHHVCRRWTTAWAAGPTS